MSDAMGASQARTLGAHRALARIYLRCVRGIGAGQKAVQGTFDGLWLGVLSPEQLHVIDEAHYQRDGLYVRDDYNRSGLFDWEEHFVEAHLTGARRVAVTGAGGGREVRALAAIGLEPVGFECNDKLRLAGNRMLDDDGFSARILPCARDRWPRGEGPFDALVVGWGSYMLMAGRDRRIDFLRCARQDLRPGAPVLLSFFARTGSSRELRLTASVGGAIRRIINRPPLEVGDSLAPNYVHWFDNDQIMSELGAAGYDLMEFEVRPYGRAVARVRP